MERQADTTPHARKIHIYVASVAALALACVGGLFLTDVGELDRPWIVAVIALLIAVEGATAVKIAKAQGQSEVQGPEEALLVFMALAFSPITALLTVAAGALVADTLARRGALKTLFNTASFTGAAALALVAVDLVAGTHELGVRRIFAVLVGALLFAGVTRAAVSGVLTIALGISFREDFVDDLRGSALLLAGNASVGLLAGLAALSHSWTVPFALAAMLALSFSFSGHARAKRQTRMLDDLVSSSWDGIFSVDEDGAIRLWNPAMDRLSGLAAADVLGRHASSLLEFVDATGAQWAGLLMPGWADADGNAAVVCLRTAREPRWLRISRSPLPEGGYAFIVRDVTVDHEREASIRAAETQLRLALEAGSMAWWEWDMLTDDLTGSESLGALFGVAPGRLGRRIQDLVASVHADDRDPFMRAFDHARESGRLALAYRAVWPDGTTRWLETSGRLRTSDDRSYMIGISRDITARKEMEANLLHAQKTEAIGTLAAGIAHDFNNMLAAVNGYSELTLAELEPDHPVRENIEQIAAAGARAAAISAQLLTFSRKQVAEPGAVDLRRVVEGIEALLRRFLPVGVEVVVVADAELGMIRGDTGELEQVLINLAVNAGHAMPAGGTLTIELANVDRGDDADGPTGSCVRLAVTDTGMGMDEVTRARIFEPFFTSRRRGEGTGLGLAMVAAIVEQSRGVISVETSPGAGTTFELLFPLLAGRSPAEDIAGFPDTGVETVLLVDDSAGVRAYQRLILEDEGYVVLEAGTPAEAIEVAAAHAGPIHVLVTDVVMPQTSGPELSRRLSPSQPDLRVVYVSGASLPDVVQHGVAESDTYLPKPVTPELLASTVRGVAHTTRSV